MRIRGLDCGTFARAVATGWRGLPATKHVFLCIADHFEPEWAGASADDQRRRIDRWVVEYPRMAGAFSDARGRPPQHTFFTPIECYQADLLDRLLPLIHQGFGDIEVHLHHENDTADNLHALLSRSIEQLHARHGLLSRDARGNLRYGFIHGNWALNNSHPEGHWCGVNNELSVLRATGCYADFTMPSAPHASQTQTINSIYYASDDPPKPKAHDRGTPATVGQTARADELLLIQGPLLIRQRQPWSRPRLENGNIAKGQPATAERLLNWLRARVHVKGQDEWTFIKLHTHGAPEKNAAILLGDAMAQFHKDLNCLASQHDFKYYYVTAREMAQLVGQAERGLCDPVFDQLSW